jgi:hypothetical protein
MDPEEFKRIQGSVEKIEVDGEVVGTSSPLQAEPQPSKPEWPIGFTRQDKRNFKAALKKAKKKGYRQGTPEFNQLMLSRGFVAKTHDEVGRNENS